MANPRVTTIGSALVDVFIQSPQFFVDDAGSLRAQVIGGKLSVDSFQLKTGGGASNTAVGFARMGCDTRIVSELGHDELAELVIRDLEKEGVQTELLIQERKEETGGSVIVIDTDSGDRTVLTHRGASSMLEPHDLPPTLLETELIHVTSLSGQRATLAQIFESGAGSQAALSWNPGQADIELLVMGQLAVPARLDFLFVNQQEWAMLASKQAEIQAVTETIAVTNGAAGGQLLLRGQEPLQYDSFHVEAVDTTGAGDAFAVGFLAGHLHQQPVEVSLDWARKNATSVVLQLGAKAGLLRK